METVKEAMEFAAEIESGKPLGPTFCKEWRDKATSAIVLLAHRVDELCEEVNDLVYRMNGWTHFLDRLPEIGEEILYFKDDGTFGTCVWNKCATLGNPESDPLGYSILTVEDGKVRSLIYWMPIPEFPSEECE